MKTFRKLFVASAALFVLTACNIDNSLSISNKDYNLNSFTEISVDAGLYGSESGFIGANKDELCSKVKNALVIPDTNKLRVSGTNTKGFTYNGKSLDVYAVSEYTSSEGFSSNKCYIYATTTANEYKLLNTVGGGTMELKDLTYSLGYRTHSKTEHGITVNYTYSAEVAFEAFKYNPDEETLTTKVTVKDTKTVDEEATTKTGTFNLTFKA